MAHILKPLITLQVFILNPIWNVRIYTLIFFKRSAGLGIQLFYTNKLSYKNTEYITDV